MYSARKSQQSGYIQAIILLLIVLAIPVIAFLVSSHKTNQDIRSHAATPPPTDQTSLQITTDAQNYVPGATIVATIGMNVPLFTVNAVEADVSFDATKMDFVSADYTNSVFPLQVAQDTSTVGVIKIARGATTPISAGQIAKLTFKLKAGVSGQATFSFLPTTQVLDSVTNTNDIPQSNWQSATVTVATLGDLNGDGKVDINDFNALVANYGTSNAASDLNHDGTVNLADVNQLLANWTCVSTCPTPIPTAPATEQGEFTYTNINQQAVNQNTTFTIHPEVCSNSTVNAASVTITYPTNLFTLQSIDYATSKFPLQVEEVKNTGSVRITRGTSGWLAQCNEIAALTFKANAFANGTGSFAFNNSASQIYSNQTLKNIYTSAQDTPVTYSVVTKIGDLNGDNAINIQDFSVLLSDWAHTTAQLLNPRSDLNGDGIVNIVDFSILLSHWGT